MKLSKRVRRHKFDGSIIIDEGDGYKLRAYKLNSPPNGKLVDKFFGSAFNFVVVEWMHPNYGYFADAGFFWKSMHMDWQFVPVVGWMGKYEIPMEQEKKSPIMGALKKIADKVTKETLPAGINLFLKDYPEFKELFE